MSGPEYPTIFFLPRLLFSSFVSRKTIHCGLYFDGDVQQTNKQQTNSSSRHPGRVSPPLLLNHEQGSAATSAYAAGTAANPGEHARKQQGLLKDVAEEQLSATRTLLSAQLTTLEIAELCH